MPGRIVTDSSVAISSRENGKVTDEIFYLSAIEESDFVIAQASAQLNDKGELVEELVASLE